MTNKAFKSSVGMSVEEGVKKAIEGGYNGFSQERFSSGGRTTWIGISTPEGKKIVERYPEVFLLDPIFWIALSKAEGWADEVCSECGEDLKDEPCYKHLKDGYRVQSGWLYQWLKFINTLASLAEDETR